MLSSIISICALAFTIGSFWWLFARRGHVVAYEPYSFSAPVADSTVLLLRFPFVFENTGPKAIVIQDLRLCFPDEKDSVLPLPWRTSRTELKPSSLDGHKFPAVFALAGRTANQYFIEFGAPFPGFAIEKKDYRVRVETRVAHKRGWQELLEFPLRAGNISSPENYITYSNAPFDPTDEDKDKVNHSLQRLAEKLADGKNDEE